MIHNDELYCSLTMADDTDACAKAAEIVRECSISDKWLPYFDVFASLLSHKKSLVRNRGVAIIASLSRWDKEGKTEAILPEFFSLLSDPKPITVRKTIEALGVMGELRKDLVPSIVAALSSMDASSYKDSMRPLIEKDREVVLEKLSSL